jgi:hypothetical protein
MPHFVEGLTDVDDGLGAEAFVFQMVVDFVDYFVHLFDSSVFCSESELMRKD